MPDGVDVVGVVQVTGDETIIAATREARAMLCPAEEVNVLSGPGPRRDPDQDRRHEGSAARVHRLDGATAT